MEIAAAISFRKKTAIESSTDTIAANTAKAVLSPSVIVSPALRESGPIAAVVAAGPSLLVALVSLPQQRFGFFEWLPSFI